LKQLRPAGSSKVGLIAAVTAFAVLCLSASALAATYPESPSAPQASTVPTVFIKADKKGLRFDAPKTVVAGEELAIVNQTDPHKVGPHTFSLVTKGSVPTTPKARQLCFTPKHICKAIAIWHGVKGNGPVKVNPVEVGAAGWDTLGSVTKKGDSWFTGEKPGTSFSQPVSVDTSAGASRIYFICAIHSFMHGSINVLPGG
jgi:hypothetical protein